MKFSNFFFRFKNSCFASYGPYIGYQGLILTPRSPAFQPCQNFQIIPVTFWVMGVLIDRGRLAPFFWWYKNKVGVYLNDPRFRPNCPIFTKIFFLEGVNLSKTLVPFFYLWVHFWIFHGQKCKKTVVQPRSTIYIHFWFYIKY